jgi:hypothetical protein
VKLLLKNRSTFKIVLAVLQFCASDIGFAEANDGQSGPQTTHCVGFPENSPTPPVEVCSDGESYTFKITDSTIVFNRQDFEERVASAASLWLSSHNQSIKLLTPSAIQIWMTVPEANPAAAQPRAVVETTAGRVTFWFDLTEENWEFHDSETAILGDAMYPDSFGYRPLKILAKSQPDIPEAAVVAALVKEGAKNVINEGSSWFSATGGLFKEKAIAFRSIQNHGNVLKYVQVNSVFEWIADRGVVFSFTVPPQDVLTAD